MPTPTTVRLRGLSAVNGDIAWASGVKGTVIRTVDGGATWVTVSVPGAEALDFRDIEAYSADEAVVMAAGPGKASRLYRTTDGGQHWSQVLQNLHPDGFYDCMVFEADHGWLLGDPIEGRYQLFETRDRGAHWSQSGNGPPAADKEAAFAASGTCITRHDGQTFVATGGGEANLHRRRDGSGHWFKMASGMARGAPAAGVFSAAPYGSGVMLVGGDYTKESAAGDAAVFSQAGLRALPAPRGYRSGVACFESGADCVAVGPSGVDLWNGQRWQAISDDSYDSVVIAKGAVWMSGAKGRVGRLLPTP